jgi:hypothetical protein
MSLVCIIFYNKFGIFLLSEFILNTEIKQYFKADLRKDQTNGERERERA